jgi:hypothetical protein
MGALDGFKRKVAGEVLPPFKRRHKDAESHSDDSDEMEDFHFSRWGWS